MFTSTTSRTQRMAGTVAAIFVVAFSGLMLEHGHNGAIPRGVVEVGELTPLNLEQLAMVTLPGVEIVGSRQHGMAVVLPEIEVVGSRELLVADAPTGRDKGSRG